MRKTQRIEILAALIMFVLFAVCALAAMGFGAKSYRTLTKQEEEDYTSQTVSLYLGGKVRQAGNSSCISVEDFHGNDCMRISSTVDGVRYETRVYSYDGWIRELFTLAGSELEPGDGEKVIETGELSISEADGLIRFRIGEDFELLLSTGKGGNAE